MPSIDCHVPVQSSVPVSLSSSLRRIPRCLYWIFGRPRAPSAGPVGTLFHIYKEAQMERTLLRPGAPLDRQTRGRPATGSSMSLSETQTCKAWSLTDRGCVLALFSEVSWHTQVLLKHFTSVYMPTKPKCLTILTKVLLIHRWPAHGPEWPKVITVRLRDCGDTKVSYWPFLWYIMLPIWIYDASSTALDYICFTPSFSDIFSNTDKCRIFPLYLCTVWWYIHFYGAGWVRQLLTRWVRATKKLVSGFLTLFLWAPLVHSVKKTWLTFWGTAPGWWPLRSLSLNVAEAWPTWSGCLSVLHTFVWGLSFLDVESYVSAVISYFDKIAFFTFSWSCVCGHSPWQYKHFLKKRNKNNSNQTPSPTTSLYPPAD